MDLVLTEVKEGNLKTARERLRTLKIDLKSSVHVIATCCKACKDNSLDLQISDLLDILKLCLTYIPKTAVHENVVDCYLGALYHIMQFVLNKGYEDFEDFEVLLLPEFLDNLTPKQSTYYVNISKSFFNRIMCLTRNLDAPAKLLLSLSAVSLKMFAKVSSKATLLHWYWMYMKSYIAFNIEYESLRNQNEMVARLTETAKINADENDLVFKTTVQIIKSLHHIVAMQCKFSSMMEYLKTFSTVIGELDLQGVDCYREILLNISSFIDLICKPQSVKNIERTVQNCIILFNKLQQQTGINKNFILFSEMLTDTFKKLHYDYIHNFSQEKLSKTLTANVLVIQLKFFEALLRVGQLSHTYCKACSQPSLFTTGVSVSLFMVKTYMNNNEEIFDEILDEIFQQFETYCDDLVLAKKRQCPVWQTSWRISSIPFYNICLHLKKINSSKSLEFFKLFIKHLVDIEGTGVSIIRENFLTSCLSSLADIYFKNGDVMEAMILTSSRMYFNRSDKDAIRSWIKCKNLTMDKEFTLVSVLENGDAVREIIPNLNLNLTKDDETELIILELELYKANWPSKSSMVNAFRHLLNTADALTCAKTFLKIWNDQAFRLHENMFELLKKLLENLRVEKNSPEVNLLIACLNYFYYKCEMTDLINQNIAQMEKCAVSPLKSDNHADDPPDPNDECDIATLHENLNVDCVSLSLKRLMKGLNLIETNLNAKKSSSFVCFQKEINLIGVILCIANEFRLHLYGGMWKKALFLALKAAKLVNDMKFMLDALSGLLEVLNVKTDTAKELLKSGEFLVKKLHECDDANVLSSITNFYISKSNAFFNQEIFTESSLALTEARKIFDRSPNVSEETTITTRLKHLEYKHATLPCNLHLYDHNQPTLTIIHEALNLTVNTKKQSCPYTMSILFDTFEETGRLYKHLKMPRHMRCYLKEIVILAQNLLVPLRAVRLLSVLLQADLLMVRLPDAQVKINGIKHSLCLDPKKMDLLKVEKRDVWIDEAEKIQFAMREMTLDGPERKECVQPGSPLLAVEGFHFPGFVGHSNGCGCFKCSCREYQELVLEMIRLEGLIAVYKKSCLVDEYFDGALKVFEKLLGKNSVNKMEVFEETNWIFQEVYCYILLDFTRHLLRTGRKDEAENKWKELLSIAEMRKLKQQYLWVEVLFVRTLMLWKPVVYRQLEIPMEKSRPVEFVKTPENHASNGVFKKPIVSTVETKIRRLPRTKLFDISDENKETPVKSSKSVQKKNTARKFDVYTPKSVKSSKKLSKMRTEPLSPIPLPESKNFDLSKPVKLENKLDVKTRLLTEKIKVGLTDKPFIACTDENTEILSSEKKKTRTRTQKKEETVSTRCLRSKKGG